MISKVKKISIVTAFSLLAGVSTMAHSVGYDVVVCTNVQNGDDWIDSSLPENTHLLFARCLSDGGTPSIWGTL